MTHERPPVVLRGVCKRFGPRVVLEQVDLTLHRDRITVIVGPSGGGKSVLLDLILGLAKPDRGVVRVGDTLGMVFQDNALFDDISVADNLGFPLRDQPRSHRVARAKAAARAVSLTDGHLGARPAQLSGGLRKRAAIARTLVQAPQVLLYDEPTAGLDAAAAARVGQAILEARRAVRNQAVLVVTHDYALAATIADEIHHLDPERHRLETLYAPTDLEALGERAQALPAIRDRLEAHFIERADAQGRSDAESEASASSSHAGPERSWPARLIETGGVIAAAVVALARVRWPSLGALAKRLWDVGVTSTFSIAASGLVLGLVTALQIGQALNATLGDLDSLPSLLGVVLCHHVGPLYTGLFLAGRVGARVASEIGVKTYLRQGDALLTFGARPEVEWLSPLALAGVLAFPLLALLLEAAAILGGYATYVMIWGQNTAGFEHTVLADVYAGPVALGLARAAATGLAVVCLAFGAGRTARRGSDAVGRATTRAVVAGLMAAIAVELVFSLGSI